MEYRLTLIDNSSVYLSHSGVKGMKWGKWNAETAARYKGRSRKIGGDPALVTFGKKYGKTSKILDSTYNKHDKADRYDVELFRDAAKSDAKAYKSWSKMHPKGSKLNKQYKRWHLESLAEASAMTAWLNKPYQVPANTMNAGKKVLDQHMRTANQIQMQQVHQQQVQQHMQQMHQQHMYTHHGTF